MINKTLNLENLRIESRENYIEEENLIQPPYFKKYKNSGLDSCNETLEIPEEYSEDIIISEKMVNYSMLK